MNVVFRIRRKYFDRIVRGTKRKEVRRVAPYWDRVIVRVIWSNAAMGHIRGARKLHVRFRPGALIGVFVCGKDVHRREITRIRRHRSAKAALGRWPSVQGYKDLGDGPVYAFYLGTPISGGTTTPYGENVLEQLTSETSEAEELKKVIAEKMLAELKAKHEAAGWDVAFIQSEAPR